MADAAVAAALRSAARLVVIEAPGGCGKTYQGAAFAADICPTLAPGRLLVLTHTHAACDVFADRTRGLAGLEIRTVDSLIGQIAEAYPEPGMAQGALPDYDRNGRWAAGLLKRRPFIAEMLARRYPMVICDEHQDASAEQHAVIVALHGAGARIRAFGDPMQRIYGAGTTTAQGQADDDRWAAFQAAADLSEPLDVPHRWRGGGEDLGAWILENRTILAAGGKLRLTGALPSGLKVVFADNTAQRNLGFQLDARDRRNLDSDFMGNQPLVILSHHNATVQAIRAFLGRSMPIWEGHTRSALPTLVQRLSSCGDAAAVAGFGGGVRARGLHGLLRQPVRHAISQRGGRRMCKAGAREAGADPGLGAPDRRPTRPPRRRRLSAGPARCPQGPPGLRWHPHRLSAGVWEAVRLGASANPQTGLAELARHNAHARRLPPRRAISTIHKAKGLEASNVEIMPCDSTTFREKDRRLLYVAISRATRRLTLVVSRSHPSPIIEI